MGSTVPKRSLRGTRQRVRNGGVIRRRGEATECPRQTTGRGAEQRNSATTPPPRQPLSRSPTVSSDSDATRRERSQLPGSLDCWGWVTSQLENEDDHLRCRPASQ